MITALTSGFTLIVLVKNGNLVEGTGTILNAGSGII